MAIQVEPANAEAHTGLCFVRAAAKAPAASAQQEADLALLHAADLPPEKRYLILHNIACIYATLAQNDPARAAAHEDVAVALLRRALDLWKRAGTGLNEIQLIQEEPSFPAKLRERVGVPAPPPK